MAAGVSESYTDMSTFSTDAPIPGANAPITSTDALVSGADAPTLGTHEYIIFNSPATWLYVGILDYKF